MRYSSDDGYEPTNFAKGDRAVVACQNRYTHEADRHRYKDHRLRIGEEVKLVDWDASDGTFSCQSKDGTTDWVHEDCLEKAGPSSVEVAQAIASITGQSVPPTRPDQDPTVPFLQGYMVMGLMQDWKARKLPLKVRNVEQLTGPDGAYLNHCTVVTESGKRIRITFEEDA